MAGENKQPEDEVGWAFVHEYYTMMSEAPGRLHLFYKKASTFVHGSEGESSEKTQQLHGQREILNKVTELDYKDCKVLVTNVDSQAAFGNTIIIQVLGEMSNKGEDSRKFAQTFLLAPQEFGYYVHNDIFRLLKEDVDDSDLGDDPHHLPREDTLFSHNAPQQQQQTGAVSTPQPKQTNGNSHAAPTAEPEIKQQKMHAPVEEVIASPTQTPAASQPEPTAERSEAVETIAKPPPSATVSSASEPSQAQETAAVAEEKIPKVAAPAEPVKPAAPLSWAARAAANAAKTATAAVVNKVAPVVASATAPAPTAAQKKQPAEQAATAATNTQQQHGNEASKSAFLKSLTPTMSEETIRRELGKHGAFKTVEINRAKKCGFVDYLSTGACASAIKQHLFDIDGETLQVEERRKDVNPGKGPYGGKKFDKSGRGSPRVGGGNGARTQQQGTARTSTPAAK